MTTENISSQLGAFITNYHMTIKDIYITACRKQNNITGVLVNILIESQTCMKDKDVQIYTQIAY